ncbi:hypothetical protein AABB24_037008 [Solanum stoloniferum]|uniref:Uncharacterized protein n=1 Tax=Solanum stoloniferum TaxID=62892 RepID=A0ABD2R2P8_9SOLN
MKGISSSQTLSAFALTYIGCATRNNYIKPTSVAKKSNNSHTPSSKDTDTPPPRITSNLKQNLQFLKLWKEFPKRKSSTPKPATSYRKKKVEKEELPGDEEIYRDPTLALY